MSADFKKKLVILYQSGETQILFLINDLGAFHLGLIPIITTMAGVSLMFYDFPSTFDIKYLWLHAGGTFSAFINMHYNSLE